MEAPAGAVQVVLALHDAGGTVPPMVAVAQALVRRGHHVSVLSQPSVPRAAPAAGCAFVPLSVPDYDHDRPIEDQLELAGELITGRGPGDDLLRVVEDVAADVVLVDANLAGVAAAAEVAACPSAVLFHSLYATYVDVWFGELWPYLAPAIDETRATYGLASATSWADVFGPHQRRFVVVPEAFDVPRYPEGTPPLDHVGFLVPVGDEGEGPSVVLDRRHEHAALISLSTTDLGQRALLQTILDALADQPVDALLTTGRQRLDPDLRVPTNVAVRGHVPHAAVLDQVDVVITHAGLGTVAAALSHGVPLVCTPISRDQPLNARRVADLGAGRTVAADDATPDLVRAAVHDVLADDAHRLAAQRLAAASAEAGGADALAEALVDLARSSSRPDRRRG